MSAFIDWIPTYGMFSIFIMSENDATTFFVPVPYLITMKFLFKRLGIQHINLGASIEQHHREVIESVFRS